MKETLGHSDGRQTMDTYIDLPIETQRKELQKYVDSVKNFSKYKTSHLDHKNRVVKDKINLTTLFLTSYFIAKPFSSASSEKTPLLKSTLKTSISSIETSEQPYLLRISSFIS